KKMRRLLFLLFICLFASVIAMAQASVKTEYGKTGDLKGLTKIFIDTDGDTEERNRMVEEFTKEKLTGVTLLDSIDGAEIVLSFTPGQVAYNRGSVSNGNGNMGTTYRSAGN